MKKSIERKTASNIIFQCITWAYDIHYPTAMQCLPTNTSSNHLVFLNNQENQTNKQKDMFVDKKYFYLSHKKRSALLLKAAGSEN